jgi:hypothetical protein
VLVEAVVLDTPDSEDCVLCPELVSSEKKEDPCFSADERRGLVATNAASRQSATTNRAATVRALGGES